MKASNAGRRAGFRGEISVMWGLRIPLLLACAYLIINLTGALGPAAERTDPAQADVEGFGFVLDALTGTPIQDARVMIGNAAFTTGRTGQYNVGRLSLGERIAIATRNNYVPSGTVFSAYAATNGTTSVHIPPIYMVPRQPATPVPPLGGTISHNDYQLRIAVGGIGIAASLTGFGAHPGTPPPPDEMPILNSPKRPRSPELPTVRPGDPPPKPIPLGVAFVELPANRTATLRVPMVLPSEAMGVALPLLRFNEMTGLWERAGDLNVVQLNPHIAEGQISRGGLYMLVSTATIRRASVFPQDDSTDVTADLGVGSVVFTLPVSFEIDEANPAGMRNVAFWVYGLRLGDGNLTGVIVNFIRTAFGLVTEPSAHCPEIQVLVCAMQEGTFIDIDATSVDGCGNTVDIPGICLCCPKGSKPSVNVKAGKASDEYGIDVGASQTIDKISGELRAKANKRKEDISISYECK
ncbi:MAG: hypothetical protein HY650_16255 [Acidobacteria bacterium]|nr:hypothetical protein [Acidobacteriota bacterium]